jgi:hypothetical protein
MTEPLNPLTAHLIDLFHGPLRDVRFPDADGERLTAAVDAAAAARDALTRAEAAVAVAREALVERDRIVGQETERTLAYARVYAVDRPELRAALEAVPPRAGATRRGPGRPRKAATVTPEAAETPAIAIESSAAE